MTQPRDVERFIASCFRSVWSLELLLHLKREPRPWTRSELVTTMRASELVVSNAIEGLAAAGLAVAEEDRVTYMPVSAAVGDLVAEAEKLYAARPDAVRRIIVSASSSAATAFADAFRLRKD